MLLSNNSMLGIDKLFQTSRLHRNYLIQQIEKALRDLFLIATDLDKLLSNNVNLMLVCD
ncbi:hypothetical protein DPMN_022008 [Dreissena polymorpha]|uniref:Uncharacterized protein n=1 Tax=Dreissena polymorpha TaxID=45954 RepID=A0A9D4SC69_DREPO|nr:hypothetical protein DPMN_022008 [Dreissena polymorpha]